MFFPNLRQWITKSKELKPYQGHLSKKFFVTLEEDNIERSALLALCKNIANDYSEFSNFVICIYDNSEIGRSIAAGENKLLGSDEKETAG